MEDKAKAIDETVRILLVDDEKVFRDSSHRLLTARGYEVITAENGQTAMEALLQNHVDMILVDLKMPVMDGAEFLKLARPLYPEIPIIIITGHGSMDLAVECMKAGAYDFITKPFDLDVLLVTLKRAMDKRRMERKSRQFQEELVQSHLELSTEKKRLETIISCMANGVMVTDRNLEIVLHNPALLRLAGIREEVRNPIPVDRIIDDSSFLETLRRIGDGKISEKEFISQELHVGDKVLMAITTAALGPDRKVFWAVAGAVTVLEDITVFKDLDRMKTNFVNMVAHELRSPLVSIRQLQSVLLEGMAGDLQEKQMDFVSRGIRKIDALLELINDLLSVAKLEEGRLFQHPTQINASEMITEMVKLMEPRAGKQGISLTCSCEDSIFLCMDPKNMEKVLENLISNAINYSPDGGKVSVTAKGAGDMVEIAVSDTGVGIPAEELPKIFEKFYRVKDPKTRQINGTGLGLSLVKGIVDGYHGTIDVESVPEKGTTFRVRLPEVKEEDPVP